MPDELSDKTIIGLALGGFSASWALKLRDWEEGYAEPKDAFGLVGDKKIKKRAEKIILREVARLADGEDVDQEMRFLIAEWCRQQLNDKKRGRPDGYPKDMALLVAYTNKLEKGRKRESIIEEIIKEFGVSRRRVFDALERTNPVKRNAHSAVKHRK
jgi:hypothetical protein